MEMCSKALDIQLKTLPRNHPSFAQTYRDMAQLHGEPKVLVANRKVARSLLLQIQNA